MKKLQYIQLNRRTFIKGVGAVTGTTLLASCGQSLLPSSPPATVQQLPDDPLRPGSNYVHPIVEEPLVDGVRQVVPELLGNRRLAAMGLVDVTAAPFNADPTGREDSTQALQQAIDYARDYQMVTYFPFGTYRVFDTLSAAQGFYRKAADGFERGLGAASMFPCVLVGERQPDEPDRRPTIVLAPRSPGFGDADNLKPVVYIWKRNPRNPETEQTNSSFNQMFVNIDVTVGSGNSGAVAVKCRGAQGTAVQDCVLNVTHGHTGLDGGNGSGGGDAGVTVIGGRIGLDLRESQPAATITGMTLINQTEAAILNSATVLSAVGLKIISRAAGPLIVNRANYDLTPPKTVATGPISLIDSEINLAGRPGGEAIALSSDRSVYLQNVYVRGVTKIVDNLDGSELAGDSSGGWTHVKTYAHGAPPEPYRGYQYEAPVYLDGVRSEEDVIDVARGGPPSDLQSRHLWNHDFPGWESSGAVNVKDAPYNATGDSQADDTEALQRAIDENEIVFLPKGYYRVTRTITLKASTKLVGVAQHLSTIMTREELNNPVLATEDASTGDAILAFCGVYSPAEFTNTYTLDWRVGRRSMVRSAQFISNPGNFNFTGTNAERAVPFTLVSGSGGGRWYNYYNQFNLFGADHRHLLIEGTSEPLHLYACNPEHAHGDAHMEVRDARNVSIYGLKSEGNETVLWVRDSDHVSVYGYSGNAAALEGRALLRFENTPDFLVSNAVDLPTLLEGDGNPGSGFGIGVDPETWHMISDQQAGEEEIKTVPLDRPVLYRRGNPVTEE